MNEVLSKETTSIYASVTRKIANMIEGGVGTYTAPWHVPDGMASQPLNAATHAEYRGVNILSLWIDARMKGYSTNVWASYRQWQELGAQVRKGERGSSIIFYKRLEPQSDDTNASHTELARFVAKTSRVFNASQVDGFRPTEIAPRSEVERIGEVEAFVGALHATIRHGSAVACYRRSTDSIEMPEREWFVGSECRSPTEAYYAVLLHELTHWTGAPHRLARLFGTRFGDEAYAMEELVAELGAAFACAAFGLSTEPRPDHAAYVASWLTVLKRDARAIFVAARKAQEAFDHLCYLVSGPSA